MSILNVIQEVAKQNGVRPSQPLTSAVVASQIAISASPISAATSRHVGWSLKRWASPSARSSA